MGAPRPRAVVLDAGALIAFERNDGFVCYCVSTEMDRVKMEHHPDGTFRAVLTVPRLPLLGGGYYLNVGTIDNRSAILVYDVKERLCPFRVRSPSDEFGLMRMEHEWAASDASPLGGA